MEFCGGGRLLDEMAREGRFSEQRATNVIKELMAMVKYCHEMGVVHRDIKPENILLTKAGKMKLADFGLVARVTNGDFRVWLGYRDLKATIPVKMGQEQMVMTTGSILTLCKSY